MDQVFRLFDTPGWFSGWDLAFDALTLIVALLIAGYSWRIYRISKENRYGYFSLAFVLIALASVFKIITQGLVYFIPWRDVATAVLPVSGINPATGINYSKIFFKAGFFMNMATMLGAWLLIFFISQKKGGRLKKYYEVSQIALFIYLILLISVVANYQYSVFYATSTVILGMTVLNYYKNYLNTDRNKNAFKVMIAFLLILLANIFFGFVIFSQNFYAVGEILLLGGFLLLLYTYHKIVKK